MPFLHLDCLGVCCQVLEILTILSYVGLSLEFNGTRWRSDCGDQSSNKACLKTSTAMFLSRNRDPVTQIHTSISTNVQVLSATSVCHLVPLHPRKVQHLDGRYLQNSATHASAIEMDEYSHTIILQIHLQHHLSACV